MKIIIEHGNTRREIKGAFNVFGTDDDLLSFAHQIIRGVERACNDNAFVTDRNVWVKISDTPQPTLSVKLKGWDE